MKRLVLLFAAVATTTTLAVPAMGAFAAPNKTNGLLPEQLCFSAYPAAVRGPLCGK